MTSSLGAEEPKLGFRCWAGCAYMDPDTNSDVNPLEPPGFAQHA